MGALGNNGCQWCFCLYGALWKISDLSIFCSLLLQLRFPEETSDLLHWKYLSGCQNSWAMGGRRLEISSLIYKVYLNPHAFYLVCFSMCLILSHSKIICLSPLQNKPQVSGQNREGCLLSCRNLEWRYEAKFLNSLSTSSSTCQIMLLWRILQWTLGHFSPFPTSSLGFSFLMSGKSFNSPSTFLLTSKILLLLSPHSLSLSIRIFFFF